MDDDEIINQNYNCFWITIKNFDVFKLIVNRNDIMSVTRLVMFGRTFYEKKTKHSGGPILEF